MYNPVKPSDFCFTTHEVKFEILNFKLNNNSSSIKIGNDGGDDVWSSDLN